MAILTVTNQRSGATITLPPSNSIEISTLEAQRCDPKLYQTVDNRAYFDANASVNSAGVPAIGTVLFSDPGLTVLYNTTGSPKDYNILNMAFISLGSSSERINQFCR